MTAIAWWTSFSNCLMHQVRQHILGDGIRMLHMRVLDCVLIASDAVVVVATAVLECVLFTGVFANTCVLTGDCCCLDCSGHWIGRT